MTSTQPLPLPYLELPMPDDVMELSSEYDRRPGTDEDIDIDIDFVTEEVQDQDNDYIIEDASEVGIGGQDSVVEMGNDDIMLDEEGSLAETHDDTLVQDEDIDDVRDFTLNEFNNESAPIQEVTDQFHDEAENHGQYTALPDDRPYDAPLDDFEGKITEASDNQTFGIRQGEQLGTIEGDADVEELRQQTPDPNPEALRGSSLNYSGDEPNGDQSLVPAGKSPIALSASDVKPEVDLQLKDLLSDPGISHAEAFPHDEEPVNPVTSLHPVVVIYQGNEISLFPPSDRSDSSTFFLHHESLANNSMSDLLTACKEVLADSISEEAELEFRIEELGLRISEVRSLSGVKPTILSG